MKRFIFVLGILFTVCVFTACNWQIPEKVSVKTQAEYNFSMGNYKKDFSEELNVSGLFRNISISNSRVYDYFPGQLDTKTQQYYLRIPILEIPVDFTSYFQTSALSSAVEQMSFSKQIVIPSYSMSYSASIIIQGISELINESLSFSGLTKQDSVELGNTFERITFESGSMLVKCSGIDDGSTVTLTSNGKSTTGTFSNGEARIPLESYTIHKKDIVFKFSSDKNIAYSGTIVPGTVITKIQGISIEKEFSMPFNFSFEKKDNSDFDSCVLNKGTLNTKFVVPSDWQGVDISYEMETSGGIELSLPRTDGDEEEIDCSGKEVSSDTVNVNGIVYVQLDDASFSLNRKLKFTCESNFESFKSIAIDFSPVCLNVSSEEIMPYSLFTSVKSLTLTRGGLTGTYVNTLPAGNDITISASSNFLNLSDKSGVIAGGTEKGTLSILSDDTEREIKITPVPTQNNEFNSWDFNVSMKLPGSTEENPNRMKLVDVVPGQEYKLELVLKTETNWKQMQINAENQFAKFTAPIGFNIFAAFNELGSTLGFDFDSKASIRSVPVYIYCNKPKLTKTSSDPFANTDFSGTIEMFVGNVEGDADGITATKKVFEDGKTKEIKFVDNTEIPYVNSPNLQFSGNTLVTDLKQYNSSKNADIANLMNNAGSDNFVCINCDVEFTNNNSDKVFTITPDMFDRSTSTATLGVYMAVVLPFSFAVDNDEIFIDLKKMVSDSDEESDLFGRSSAEGTGLDFLNGIVRNMQIIYDTNLFPLYGEPDIKLKLGFNCDIKDKYYSVHSGIINIDAGDVVKIFDTYPVYASFGCVISKNTVFSIPRLTGLDMNIKLKLVTDGAYSLTGDE